MICGGNQYFTSSLTHHSHHGIWWQQDNAVGMLFISRELVYRFISKTLRPLNEIQWHWHLLSTRSPPMCKLNSCCLKASIREKNCILKIFLNLETMNDFPSMSQKCANNVANVKKKEIHLPDSPD
ncbi:hypothetical protein XENOCAPTIV_023192 [Xenoophorus captivus]|uniref:Uncharacterized protein n=1 Tax=Xenoophorus captivus TaxID=1517983 RepID=A0ABV0Q4M9_9TELE